MHKRTCRCKSRRLVSQRRAMARKRGKQVVHVSHAQVHQARLVIPVPVELTIVVRKRSVMDRFDRLIAGAKQEIMATIKFMIATTAQSGR